MTLTEPDELYALCHIFGIKFNLVADWSDGGWVHLLYLVTENGLVIRQQTVNGLNADAWRATIGRLLSARPQPLW
jgi:hypothetical protein